MNNTKIDWCDATFNPVTGCYHGCEYCYARRIAERFGMRIRPMPVFGGHPDMREKKWALHELANWVISDRDRKEPYPFGFEPTLHEYKLDEPQHWKKPRTVFVCSMADLFGEWVPDEWIEAVFTACEKAPQHRYLFLTKNPKRYQKLAEAGKLPENKRYWYGSTATGPEDDFFWSRGHNTFVSFEPLLSPFGEPKDGVGGLAGMNWAIIGAETGNRKDKVTPEKEWVEAIVENAKDAGVPVFMKNSLVPIMGEANMRRETPWEGK